MIYKSYDHFHILSCNSNITTNAPIKIMLELNNLITEFSHCHNTLIRTVENKESILRDDRYKQYTVI